MDTILENMDKFINASPQRECLKQVIAALRYTECNFCEGFGHDRTRCKTIRKLRRLSRKLGAKKDFKKVKPAKQPKTVVQEEKEDVVFEEE